MKKLLFILLLVSQFVTAQVKSPCVQVDCKDTIQLPQDSIALNAVITGTYTTAKWTQVGGFASTIVNPTALTTVARGLKPGLYVFQMTASTASALDSVVVLAPPPRTLVSLTVMGTTATATYSDGTTSIITLKNPVIIQ